MKCFNNPKLSKATPMLLSTINALSCQRYPTHNQPATPINCIDMFHGNKLIECSNQPIMTKKTDTHFTYQLRSCSGVTFLYIFLLSRSLCFCTSSSSSVKFL